MYYDREIETYFNLEPGTLKEKNGKGEKGEKNNRSITIPRQIAMWIASREYLEKYNHPGYKEIGEYFNKSRNSVRYAVRVVENLQIHERYKNMLEKILKTIYSKN